MAVSVQKCCCCCSLRAGVVFIGLLYCITSCGLLGIFIGQANTTYDLMKGKSLEKDTVNTIIAQLIGLNPSTSAKSEVKDWFKMAGQVGKAYMNTDINKLVDQGNTLVREIQGDFTKGDIRFYALLHKIFCGLSVMFGVQVLVNILLLVSTVKNSPILVYIWILYHTMYLIINTSTGIGIGITLFEADLSNAGGVGSGFLIMTLISAVIAIYFLVVVNSFYKYLKNLKRQEDPQPLLHAQY